MRRLLATLALGALLVSCLVACAFPTDQQAKSTAIVGTDGFEISAGDVTASAPGGVAPAGTEVTLEVTDRTTGGDMAPMLTELGSSVSLKLGDGLQPGTPIDLRFKFDETAMSGEDWSTDATVLIVTESEGGTVGLLETAREGDYLTARTEHLSFFQPIQVDLGAALATARDFVMQSLGLEVAAPDCLGKAATSSLGYEYTIAYRGVVHPCISAAGDTITVDLYAATMMPYRVKSWPEITGGTVASPDGQGILMALADKWVPSASGGVLMGGGAYAHFQFSASNPPQVFDARQDAQMLIGAVLLNLIGIVVGPLGGGAAFMDKVGELDCLSGVVNVGTSHEFNATTAADLFRTMLSCVGTLGAAAALPIRIALGLIGAVPALFAGSAVGLYNEIIGQGTVRITVEERQVAIPGVPTELSGTWCTRSGDECFSFTDLRQRFPDAAVEWTGPNDKAGVTQFQLCLEYDMGDGCSTAASMYLHYYPVGIAWDCPAYAISAMWDRCEPDYTSAHDSSKERLAIVPNHQHGPAGVFIDVEPMYRQ